MTRLTRMALVMLLALALGVTAVVAQAGPETISPGANPHLAFVHLAPFAADPDTAGDIQIDGNPFAAGVAYGVSTAYIQSVSGTRLIEVFAAGSTARIMSKSVTLLDGKDHTVVAIGGAKNWDLELIVLEDDTTAPASGRGKVRVGHLAPFAVGAANLPLTSLPGQPVNSVVQYILDRTCPKVAYAREHPARRPHPQDHRRHQTATPVPVRS